MEEADLSALGQRSAPRGTLTISAPPISGEDVLRPVIDADLETYPKWSSRTGVGAACPFPNIVDAWRAAKAEFPAPSCASNGGQAPVHIAIRNYGDFPRLLDRVLIADEPLWTDL